jgi:alkylation response protein AidB-like acyl-CoA dehydrogenase
LPRGQSGHLICRGECITAIAVTEPDAGSDVAAIRTRAVRDGDHYVIQAERVAASGPLARRTERRAET